MGLLVLGLSTHAGALEIGAIGGVDNLTFHPDRVTPHGESVKYKQFQAYPYGFGDLFLKDEISSNVGYNLFISRDNILQNSISAKITTSSDYLNVEFGPFVGINDHFDKPDVGISGAFELAIPGIAFLGFSGSSSLGSKHEFMSKNSRETAQVKLGFWLPNVIPSVSAGTKSYTRRLEDSTEIRDELLRLQGSLDFHGKDIPVIFRLDGGYEVLTRSYKNEIEITDKIDAIFVGAEVKWQVTQPLRIIAGFELPVKYTAAEPMENPDNMFKLFKAHAGITYTFFKNPDKQRTVKAPAAPAPSEEQGN
jgi:hypothetical protein